MITFLKPSVTARLNGPMIETKRLILRTWREADIAPNTAMLADPDAARYITADGKPVDELNGWRNAAIMSGHWALHGYGMFVVEEKASGMFVGRVGPWHPPTWPGFEVGWGVAKEFRGKGYAFEATCASIDWVFDNLAVDRIIHTIKPDNVASQSLAKRLGATIEGQAEVFGNTVDVWVTTRGRWRRPTQAATA
jgi:RimJ/RimL family protein N-acetyltransferase